MSKVPKLPISKDGNRYRLDIHKSLSETGKRQRARVVPRSTV